MWWKPDAQVTKWLQRLQEAVETLQAENATLRRDLSDALHSARQLDLDMGTLEDRFKALTGRVSVNKRKDRQPEAEPEPEKDINEMIRSGELGL